MDRIFLTFIVPVYNAEQYLCHCINSLLEQDLPREAFEVLCVNDGSTDMSAQILDAYATAEPNVRVIHQENAGVAAARNAGLAAARGEFIWFVDSDDLVAGNLLGRLRTIAEETQCHRIVVDGYSFTDRLTPEEQAQTQLPCNVPWEDAVVWRSLLKREFLLEKKLTFRYPQLTHGEDGVYMYEVSMENPKTERIPVTGYFYRIHSGSADTGISPAAHRKKLRSYLAIVEILLDYYRKGRKDAVTANKLQTFLWFTLFEAAHLPHEDAAPALKQLKQLGLYPGKVLPECTLDSTYLVSREGILGKATEKLCWNLQTPWSYHSFRLLLSAKTALRR